MKELGEGMRRMIATQTQQLFPSNFDDAARTSQSVSTLSAPTVFTSRAVIHTSNAGLNPLVDAASNLFTTLGELKYTVGYRPSSKLQNELVQAINAFQEMVSPLYTPEYLVVCRYILCATFDDIIANTAWGAQSQWIHDGLLTAFNQDSQHHEKFFTILERAITEPKLYIDLMEFTYICLSMGYKGRYRATEYGQYQLEQIINNLYKHIRQHRGAITKTLSPTPLKASKSKPKVVRPPRMSYLSLFFTTACMIMIIFISLNYLMDVISNEAYKNITQVQPTVSHETRQG